MNKKIGDYTIKELKQVCKGSVRAAKSEDSKIGLFAWWFSTYFTRLFLYTKITPNQITILSTLSFFVGIFLIMFGGYLLGIAGSLVIFFSIILDGCDGEVARFRKQTSSLGGFYVEPISHDLQYGFAFLLLSHGLVLHGFPSYFYILGALAGLTKLSARLLQTRLCDVLRLKLSEEKVADMNKSVKERSIFVRIVYRINKNFFSNAGVFTVIFVCALINRVDLCVWFFGIGFSFMWIAMFGKQIYQIYQQNLQK